MSTTNSYWRARYRPIIAKVLSESEGRPSAEIRQRLREAFPDGPRQYHPYKIWLDEIKRQTGKKLLTPKQLAAAEKRNAAQTKLAEYELIYGKRSAEECQ